MSIKSKMKILGRKTWRHAPTIAMTLGIGTGIAAAVIACKKTPYFMELKAVDINNYNLINECEQKGLTHDGMGNQIAYSTNDARKDRVKAGTNLILDFTKVYWLPLAMGATSIALITFSHAEMSKRNAALGAAATSIANAFALYRQNNIALDENGVERDKKCLYGIHDETITENVYDNDGNVVASEDVTRTVLNNGLNNAYTFIFGPDNKYWRPDPLLNEDFLKRAQSELNQRLKAEGYLTLLDALKYFDFTLSKPDMPYKILSTVGWVYGYHATGDSDGFVNLRVAELNNLMIRDLDDIMDNGYILNFNVDGAIDDIIDKIERSKA